MKTHRICKFNPPQRRHLSSIIHNLPAPTKFVLSGSVICNTGWTRIISTNVSHPRARLDLLNLFAISRLINLKVMDFLSLLAASLLREYFNHLIAPLCQMGGRTFDRTRQLFFGEKCRDDFPDYAIFVGDVDVDVTDYHLMKVFRTRYTLTPF